MGDRNQNLIFILCLIVAFLTSGLFAFLHNFASLSGGKFAVQYFDVGKEIEYWSKKIEHCVFLA